MLVSEVSGQLLLRSNKVVIALRICLIGKKMMYALVHLIFLLAVFPMLLSCIRMSTMHCGLESCQVVLSDLAGSCFPVQVRMQVVPSHAPPPYAVCQLPLGRILLEGANLYWLMRLLSRGVHLRGSGIAPRGPLVFQLRIRFRYRVAGNFSTWCVGVRDNGVRHKAGM